MQFYVEAKCTKFKPFVDLVIGTVPLRETVRSLPAEETTQEDQDDVIDQLPPSAPSIDELDSDNVDMRRPMFFLPSLFYYHTFM